MLSSSEVKNEAKTLKREDVLPPVAPAANATTNSEQRRPREWIPVFLLAVVMAAQMWTSIRQLSVTSDEIDHLHAGYRYLRCNDFGWNPEHPPLAKIVDALPLLAMQVNDPIPNACGLPSSRELDFRVGHAFLFANRESMLMAARTAASLFAILLLIATWFFARTLFGTNVAFIASALVAFEPNLIGHGGLVTTDVPAALGFLLAIYASYRYLARPTVDRILVLGLAMGLALALKFSSITLIGILPALFLADALVTGGGGRMRRLFRSMGCFALAMIIAAVVLWASYGFRYASRPDGAQPWSNPRIEDARGLVPTKVIPMVESTHLLPQAYLIGLQDVFVESELGRPGYLLGHNYLGGRWYYFPVAAAIKFTVPFLLMSSLSFAAFCFWRTKFRELLPLLLPVALYMAASAASGINIGLRHVFPIIPLLAIFGAAGIWNLPLRRNIVIGALIVLLSAHAASSLHAFPSYISYGNELWGGPNNVYKHLADSNTDWGQAHKIARSYINRMQPTSCFLIQEYHNNKLDYGIPCGSISELESDIPPLPFTGTLIVSSNVVDGVNWLTGVRAARVFRDLTPTAHIGGSALLVYKGTFDLSPIIAAQHVARIGADVHEPLAVLERAKIAARLDPENRLAYLRMCQAYLYLGQRDDAQSACNKLFKATGSDIYSNQSDRLRVIQMMTINGLLVDPNMVY
ncbi:MAG: ArnT family glycosyltransferase [Terriglobales bacterium]